MNISILGVRNSCPLYVKAFFSYKEKMDRYKEARNNSMCLLGKFAGLDESQIQKVAAIHIPKMPSFSEELSFFRAKVS